MPTKNNLLKKGVALDNDLCPLCLNSPETKEHLFNDCYKVKEVRRAINVWWKVFPNNEDRLDGTAVLDTSDGIWKNVESAKEVVRYAFG